MLINSFAIYIKANNLTSLLYNKPYLILITSRFPPGFPEFFRAGKETITLSRFPTIDF